MAASEGHNLSKLISFMEKVVPDSDGIIFYDDGKKFVLQIAAADSLSATAVLPTNGKTIAPVMIKKQDFVKPYRQNAVLSGDEGSLSMRLGHWHMKLTGSEENHPPEPIIIEGDKFTADVSMLKSVPTEDSYGGSTWATFLPEGIAALTSTYSLVAMYMDPKLLPSEPVVMQANAIYPLVNLVNAKLMVNEDAAGIIGKFPIGGGVEAKVYVALAKPNTAAIASDEVLAMMPRKSSKLTVSAHDLRACIEGAKKTFGDEAKSLTFTLTEAGLNISLSSDTAALSETVPYLKRPEKAKGTLVINTDIMANAFKGLRELTNVKALASIDWNELAISITIKDGTKTIGAIVVASSEG